MEAIMYKNSELKKFEDGRPFYIVKYHNGCAYYITEAAAFDNAMRGNKNSVIEVFHILAFVKFNSLASSLLAVDFESLPENYKKDSLSLNPIIRAAYGKNYSHVQNDNMDRAINNFFKATETSLKQLRDQWVKEQRPMTVATIDNTGSSSNSQSQKSSLDMNLQIPGLNLSFGELEKGLMAIDMNGNLAFKDKSGNYISLAVDEETGQRKQVSVGNLKLDVPFYTVPTQELEVNDVVLLDGRLLVVQEKPKTGGFKFVDPITGSTTNKLERTNIVNFYFYSKVISIFDMGSGDGVKGFGLNGMNPMTMALLMGNGSLSGGSGSSNIVEMMILSQLVTGGKSDSGINPAMLMLLNKDKNTSDMLLPLMMMSGGGAGFNLFNKPKAKKAARPAARSTRNNVSKAAIKAAKRK